MVFVKYSPIPSLRSIRPKVDSHVSVPEVAKSEVLPPKASDVGASVAELAVSEGPVSSSMVLAEHVVGEQSSGEAGEFLSGRLMPPIGHDRFLIVTREITTMVTHSFIIDYKTNLI